MTWQEELIMCWSIGQPLDDDAYPLQLGCPATMPDDPIKAAQELARIGMNEDDIAAATGESTRVAQWAIDHVPPGLPLILKMHAGGMTPIEISKMLGIPRSRIYYHLHRRDLRPNRSNAPELTIRQRKAVLKAYDKGYTLRAIAKRYLITIDQVRYAVESSRGVRQ